jgi:hypothetical protein
VIASHYAGIALKLSNLDEALALLATEEIFDLIFTDLSLHGHDQTGLALATEAVRIREGIPVLYTTGQAVTDGMKAMFVPLVGQTRTAPAPAVPAPAPAAPAQTK